LKKELRTRVRGLLAEIPPNQLRARSLAACRLLCEQPEFRRAEVMMTTLSLPHELDTTALALRAWQEGKRVLAPKVSWEQRRMLPVEIRSLISDVTESPTGMREPIPGMPFPVVDIDLVIVPGLAFDAAGNRLGRGRGFFDRFLSHPDFAGVACALAFEEQYVDKVPVHAHDVPVDMLVTDQQVRRFAGRRRSRRGRQRPGRVAHGTQ
jgi:5-formyltetrahydrofolate cyclo-ligase